MPDVAPEFRMVTVRLKIQEHEQLRKLAQENEYTVAQLVRRAVRIYLAEGKV